MPLCAVACPEGHKLELAEETDWICDGCERSSSNCELEQRFRCDRCDHDLCQRCKQERQTQDEDHYGLLHLERYADMDERNSSKLQRVFGQKALWTHPDKGGDVQSMTRLNLAKTCLTTPDLKRRYDIELHKQHEELNGWSSARWWSRWIGSGLMVVAGVSIIIAGVVAAPVTFGASAAFGCTGGAMLSAGITGAMAQYQDPDKSDTEFLKDIAVSGVVGAVGGLIGAGAGCAIAKEGVTAVSKLAIAAVSGAGGSAASHVISDAADLAITNGCLGKHLKDNVTNSKTNEQVFCSENAVRLGQGVLVGAVAGVALQGVANKLDAGANATTLIDDVTVNAPKVAVPFLEKFRKAALPGVAGTMTSASLNASAEVVIGTVSEMVENKDSSLPAAFQAAVPQAAKRFVFEASIGLSMTAATSFASACRTKGLAPIPEDASHCEDESRMIASIDVLEPLDNVPEQTAPLEKAHSVGVPEAFARENEYQPPTRPDSRPKGKPIILKTTNKSGKIGEKEMTGQQISKIAKTLEGKMTEIDVVLGGSTATALHANASGEDHRTCGDLDFVARDRAPTQGQKKKWWHKRVLNSNHKA